MMRRRIRPRIATIARGAPILASAIASAAVAAVAAPVVAPAGDPVKVDAALDLVPPDAIAVLLVADPKAASDDLGQCLERMERPEVALMGRPLDMLKAQAGIGAGFDDRGPVVAWWQMPPAQGAAAAPGAGEAGAPGARSALVPVVVIGTTDPAQFLTANFEPARNIADDAWLRDGSLLYAKAVDRLVVMSPEAALARGWEPKPGFAATLRQRLGDRAISLVHGAEFSAWAGPAALASMREQSLAEARAQAGDRAGEIDRLSKLSEGMSDALLAIDVDPLGLSIRTISAFDPESPMGRVLRGGESSGNGVDRLPGGAHYLAMSIDLRGLGGGGPFMELVSLLDADPFVPPWIAENRDLVDRVQIGIYPSKLGLASGLFNDSAIFVQTKDPEKVRSLWKQWLESMAGTDGGIKRSVEWEQSRALRSGGEATAFSVTEQVDADSVEAPADAAMRRMAKQIVIGPRGFVGFLRIVPGGVVMTFSQRTDVLGRATDAAGGRSTLADSGTIRALRRWLIPNPDVEGFIGVGPIIKIASAAAAMFGMTSAVIEVPENLEPIAFAMEVQGARVETAAMVPTGVLAIVFDQAKARFMPRPPDEAPASGASGDGTGARGGAGDGGAGAGSREPGAGRRAGE